MICFLRECPLDILIYYPIVKILTERKIEHITFDLTNKSTIDVIQFFSQNPSIQTIVNYGGSHRKLIVASLCKEYERNFINLHGEERRIDVDTIGFLGTIAALATHNFVSSDASRGFLLSEGIQTPIGIFECPITHLCRKSGHSKKLDFVLVRKSPENWIKLNELTEAGYSHEVFDFMDGEPSNWKEIYGAMHSAKFIVSDSFLFDKPARYLNKHFFHLGMEVLNYTNLGKSTHLVSKKLELHDYLKQSWSELKDINQRHGLNSLVRLL